MIGHEASPYVRWLQDLDRSAIPSAGGKGANLGELVKAGLPVPPGFVVTTTAYRTHLEAAGLSERIASRLHGLSPQDLAAVTAASREITGWIEAAPIPDVIRQSVVSAYAGLLGRVAVRSSATAEDLSDASFAGQQETFLNVCGEEAMLTHVRRCWASLWTPQAISYRAGMGYAHLAIDLAVVVQAMVPADVAGVMFTANPVSGVRDEILVSATYGLGEAVVSGLVTPDTFLLSPAGVVRQRTLGSKERRVVARGELTEIESVPAGDRQRYCLTDAELAELAGLARKVEAAFGSPQDTEWALHGGRLYLLQARPITTLARTGTAEPHEPDDEPDDEPPVQERPKFGLADMLGNWPEPPMPLDAHALCSGPNAFQKGIMYPLGARPATRPTRPVERKNGAIAIQLSDMGPSPAILWKGPARLLKALHEDPLANWQRLSSEYAALERRWAEQERAARDAVSLARFIVEPGGQGEEMLARRFEAIFIPGGVHMWLVGFWVRRAVGKQAAPEMLDRLFRGMPMASALQNRALAHLAEVVREGGRESERFKSTLAAFLDEWGNRPARGMMPLPSMPTWREEPGQVLTLMDALLEGVTDLDQAADADYVAARRQVESAMGAQARRWFGASLCRARNYWIAREASLHQMEGGNAIRRRAILRLGKLLAEAGVLAEPGDIFFLLSPELIPAATGTLDVRDRIVRRKRAYARVCAAHRSGRHWFEASGSIPPAAAAPGKKPAHAGLTGLAASRGQVEGVVRVVLGPEDFGKLRKGEILVAPFTSPAWTPLFRLAAAVVTESGSAASHAAIVAREYGVPAVVAVPNATRTLTDGQRVLVDGSRGVITPLDASDRR